MKKKVIVFGSLVGVLIAFVLYRSLFVHPKVGVTTVQRGNLLKVIYATGNVTADSTATLRSESGGIVTYIGTHEGMSVKRGQMLLKTDDSDDMLRVEQAKTDLRSAQVDLQDKLENLKRMETLYESRSVTRKQLDDAKTQSDLAEISLQQSKIALKISEEELSKTRVTAPFSGVIIFSGAKLGDYLLPDAVCFQMIAPRSILVEAEVDEQDFANVKNGEKCVVAFDAFSDRRFDGFVYRIVPKTNESTKTSKVFIKLTDPPSNLNVGMTATVNIVAAELHDVLLVPRTAVMQLPESNLIYAVEGGIVRAMRVDLGATDGKFSEILGGNLRPGLEIVSEPGSDIRNGMRVEASN